MIGAMPAVAVRHERRKKGATSQKDQILAGQIRPNQLLLLRPHLQSGKGGTSLTDGASPMGSHAPSVATSQQGSRAGSPTHHAEYYRYGDECFYGKASLLHFIIFFLLGGITVVIVGAVQFKKEAGLSELRYHFLFVGALLLTVGIVLLIVKCLWFRVPIPVMEVLTDDLCAMASAAGGAPPLIQEDGQNGEPTGFSGAKTPSAVPTPLKNGNKSDTRGSSQSLGREAGALLNQFTSPSREAMLLSHGKRHSLELTRQNAVNATGSITKANTVVIAQSPESTSGGLKNRSGNGNNLV